VTASLQLWALGVSSGVLILLAVLSLLTGLLFRERGLHVHAAACALAALTVNSHSLALSELVPAGLAGIMSMSAMHARGLATQVGSFRPHRRSMSAVAVLLAGIAILAVVTREQWLLLPAAALLALLDVAVLSRVWREGQSWAFLVLIAQLALLGVSSSMAVAAGWNSHPLILAGALVAWGLGIYVATAWRSRVQGELRWRLAVARHEDPVTRLSTEFVLGERIHSARVLMRRFGHSSSLLLLHVDELERIGQMLGPRAAEAATLESGVRLRLALSRADVAARLGPYRFAVLAEGSSPQEVAASLAGRILVAGMKRPLSCAEGVFLHFRILVAPLPLEDMPTEELLDSLGKHLDKEVLRGRDRRIHVLQGPPGKAPSGVQAGDSSQPGQRA
jgi:GGDEF domain-containing protein